jgi:hypothetical protein
VPHGWKVKGDDQNWGEDLSPKGDTLNEEFLRPALNKSSFFVLNKANTYRNI